MRRFYFATDPDGLRAEFMGTRFLAGRTYAIPAGRRTDTTAPIGGSDYNPFGIFVAHDAPGEALERLAYPCRLFVVAGEPVLRYKHRVGLHEMHVVRELEPWRALGPNGREVLSLVEFSSTLRSAELARLAAKRLRTPAKGEAMNKIRWATEHSSRTQAAAAARAAIARSRGMAPEVLEVDSQVINEGVESPERPSEASDIYGSLALADVAEALVVADYADQDAIAAVLDPFIRIVNSMKTRPEPAEPAVGLRPELVGLHSSHVPPRGNTPIRRPAATYLADSLASLARPEHRGGADRVPVAI